MAFPVSKPSLLTKTMIVMMAIAILLASLPFIAHAWWYHEWRFHADGSPCSICVGCGLPAGTVQWYNTEIDHLWKCHDGSGNCIDTEEERTRVTSFRGCFFGCSPACPSD